MNSDPINLKYFPRTYTKEESETSFERFMNYLEANEFGLWAAEEKESQNFMGFIGLSEQLRHSYRLLSRNRLFH